MLLNSHISPDLFLHVPASLHCATSPAGRGQSDPTEQEQGQERERKDVTVIFFITGNPGLVGYYHTFLSLLAESEEGRGCVVYGGSLGGFEVAGSLGEGGMVSEDEGVERLLWPDGVGGRRLENGTRKIWGLKEQVELCLMRLNELVRLVEEMVGGNVKVTLMGHSVGAWIALEIVRLLHLHTQGGRDEEEAEKINKENGALQTPAETQPWPKYEVGAAFLLTPTIMEIALSEKGRIAAPLFMWVTKLPDIAQGAVRCLRWGVGERWVRWVASRVMGLDEQDSAVETTFMFLMSDRGVRQSLFLAGMEMKGIREDEWGDEVWGVEAKEVLQTVTGARAGAAAAPRLYFLFADKDYWVADETRSKIMERRGKRSKVKVVVDHKGLQHSWCLKQNRLVAEYVIEKMRESIVGKAERR